LNKTNLSARELTLAQLKKIKMQNNCDIVCFFLSSGFQLSQSAYLPLQLPFCVFGLGLTPNFVDKLEVGIPTNTSVRSHFYTCLITLYILPAGNLTRLHE